MSNSSFTSYLSDIASITNSTYVLTFQGRTSSERLATYTCAFDTLLDLYANDLIDPVFYRYLSENLRNAYIHGGAL